MNVIIAAITIVVFVLLILLLLRKRPAEYAEIGNVLQIGTIALGVILLLGLLLGWVPAPAVWR